MSDICALSAAASESQTATMEVLCENCNTVMPLKTNDGPMICKCGQKDALVAFLPDSKTYAFHKLTSGVDKEYVKQQLASAVASGRTVPGAPEAPDLLSASYFDVAVLRCLFCLNWNEDGIYWALRYVHQRTLEVCDEQNRMEHMERSRSKSLPIPILQVLQSKASSPDDRSSGFTPVQSPDSRSPSPKLPSNVDPSHPLGMGTYSTPEIRREPPYKKIRVVELKQFFDTGKSFLRKKENGEIEESGSLSSKASKHEHMTGSGQIFLRGTRDDSSSSCTVSTMDTEPDMVRPNSAIGSYGSSHRDERYGGMMSAYSAQRKSMPTLPQSDRESLCSSGLQSGQDSSNSSQNDLNVRSEVVKKPIITITEHSPEPKNLSTSNYELSGQANSNKKASASPELPRSMTDSNICYKHDDEVQEVSGSKHYIQVIL